MDGRIDRRWGVGFAIPVLLVALAACTGGRSIRESPPPAGHLTSPTPVETHAAVQPNGTEVALALPSGFAYRTYEIEALDPPTHTYTVRLVASGHPDLEVWLVSDVPLRVTDSTLPDPSCIQREMETVCEWPFPALEARPRGIWTVHILKKTDAPSAVRIAVLFEAVG